VNGPAAVVLSGDEDAFHSARIEPMPAAFGRIAAEPTYADATVSVVSTVTGAVTTTELGVPAQRGARSETAALPRALAALHVTGRDVGWAAIFAQWRGNRVELPTCPFPRDSYWLSAKPPERRDALTAVPAAERVPARGSGDPLVPLDLVRAEVAATTPTGRVESSSRVVTAWSSTSSTCRRSASITPVRGSSSWTTKPKPATGSRSM